MRIGIGAATGELHQAELSPGHPSSHGGLAVDVDLDGDGLIQRARVQIGYVHRGAEKLFESREYRQIPSLASRHEWLSAATNEIGAALAIEEALGLPVPERATWLRMLVSELNRITHHHAFLGVEAGEFVDLMDQLTGGRMHVAYARIGGVAHDLPEGFSETLSEALAAYESRYGAALDAASLASPAGLGVLTPQQVTDYGLSGVLARASGIPSDLRLDQPYLAYDQVFTESHVCTASEGDARARRQVLAAEARVSRDLLGVILERLQQLAPGPVDSKLPKVLRLPEGQTWAATESGGGVNGYHLISAGGRTPYRLAIRSASFAAAQALEVALLGGHVGQIGEIAASLLIIAGDSDR